MKKRTTKAARSAAALKGAATRKRNTAAKTAAEAPVPFATPSGYTGPRAEPPFRRLKNRKELGEHVASLISSDRNKTHGDPHRQFITAQELKKVIREAVTESIVTTGHRKLGSTELESLDLICTKLSRIIWGSNDQDAWLDTAGYALIAAERATKPLMTEVA